VTITQDKLSYPPSLPPSLLPLYLRLFSVLGARQELLEGWGGKEVGGDGVLEEEDGEEEGPVREPGC